MSNAEQNANSKGGQKAWTTGEQKAWLTEKLPAYIASSSGESPLNFWASLFEDWFESWPLGEPDESEVNVRVEDRLKKKKAVSFFTTKRNRHSSES